MLVGYARVSTNDQNLDLQRDALGSAGCERIFTDTASGAKAQRPGLAEALKLCRAGDTLVVWKLDRLGRSLPHLVETVRDLVTQSVGFKSLQENIDTTTSGGKFVFHVFASLAEFERDIIRERTKAGLSAARARGRKGGRPKGVDERKKKAAIALKKDPERSVRDICDIVGISRNTYYKYTSPEDKPIQQKLKKLPPRQPKVMKVKIWLGVENNNKFVRGKGKAREQIEQQIFSRFGMEHAGKGSRDYVLSIPYETDEELDSIINDEICSEAANIADLRNCVTEIGVTSLEAPDRTWG